MLIADDGVHPLRRRLEVWRFARLQLQWNRSAALAFGDSEKPAKDLYRKEIRLGRLVPVLILTQGGRVSP